MLTAGVTELLALDRVVIIVDGSMDAAVDRLLDTGRDGAGLVSGFTTDAGIYGALSCEVDVEIVGLAEGAGTGCETLNLSGGILGGILMVPALRV